MSLLASIVLVAVLDTGVDLEHPMIKSQAWKNPGETGADSQGRDKATNDVDDDRNGHVDDVFGWDFVDDTAEIGDPHGHGTHIAAIVTRHSKASRIMSLRYFGEPKKRSLASAANSGRRLVQAIDYAVKMGAQIINISGGGAGESPEEKQALQRAWKKGVLVIAAAGNEGRDLETHPFFPASYPFPNILVVESYVPGRGRAYKTNYSSKVRTIAALGEDIESALPGGRVGKMSGTSQATAQVTAVASELLERPESRELGAEQIREFILAAWKRDGGSRSLDTEFIRNSGFRKFGRIVNFDDSPSEQFHGSF